MTPDAVETIDVFDPRHLDDPYPMYRLLREHAPVYRVPGTDFHLVSSWELVTEAVARTDEFSSNLTGVLVQQPEGPPTAFDMDGGGQAVHVLATADDPRHAVHRKLLVRTLGKRTRALADTVHSLVDRLWSQELHDGRIEWAAGMADRLPLSVVAELIGLPDRDVPQLLEQAYASTEMLGGVVASERLGQLVTSAAEMTGYLYSKFVEARENPGDDLLGVLAQACDDGSIAQDVAVLILVQLVGAGGESTSGLIANAARILATDPGLQERLSETPALIDPFLEEVLRLESPFRAHYRHVTTATDLGGIDLPAGSRLLLLWGSANRDPEKFEAPDEIDLDRAGGRSHLAFGKGAHFCVGNALARMEAHAATTALLARSSRVTLVEDTPPRWVPSLFVRRHESLSLRIR